MRGSTQTPEQEQHVPSRFELEQVIVPPQVPSVVGVSVDCLGVEQVPKSDWQPSSKLQEHKWTSSFLKSNPASFSNLRDNKTNDGGYAMLILPR